MQAFLIKIMWTGPEVVFCDVKIDPSNNLLHLHQAIVNEFQLKGESLAEFTQFDDSLSFEATYQLEAFDEESALMSEVPLKEVFHEVGDTLDYTFDFLNELKFSLELMEELKEKVDAAAVVKRVGSLPEDAIKEFDPNEAESILMDGLLEESGSGEEEDDEFKDLFDEEGFESLDDYEGLI